MGEKYLAGDNNFFEQIWSGLNENNHANICYTSGTTADPKGMILTHRNYTANVEQSFQILNIPERYVSLLILPWDHAFARTEIYIFDEKRCFNGCMQTGKSAIER